MRFCHVQNSKADSRNAGTAPMSNSVALNWATQHCFQPQPLCNWMKASMTGCCIEPLTHDAPLGKAPAGAVGRHRHTGGPGCNQTPDCRSSASGDRAGLCFCQGHHLQDCMVCVREPCTQQHPVRKAETPHIANGNCREDMLVCLNIAESVLERSPC